MKLLLVLLLLITTVQARRLFQRSLLLKGNLESETFDFPPVDSSRYNLVIDTTDVDPTFRPAFDAAASRWQQVIVQDLPNIDSATLLHSWCPRLPDVVDDVVACAFTLHMDGPGRVLGRAGVEYRRSSTGLTITGLLEFDAADADLPEFGTVVLHELGHVVRVVQDIFFFMFLTFAIAGYQSARLWRLPSGSRAICHSSRVARPVRLSFHTRGTRLWVGYGMCALGRSLSAK